MLMLYSLDFTTILVCHKSTKNVLCQQVSTVLQGKKFINTLVLYGLIAPLVI